MLPATATVVNKIRLKVKSAYARITLNRITTAFFVFSFVHCFAQGIIQSFLFSIDSEYNALLSAITEKAQIPPNYMAFLEGTSSGHFRLQFCNEIPSRRLRRYPCREIFKSSPQPDGLRIHGNSTVLPGLSNGFTVTSSNDPNSVPDPTFDSGPGVTLTSSDGIAIALSHQCTQILVYPAQVMQNLRREDITFVALQFWLFSISFIAILYDSIPHTLAVLFTRVIVTAWAIYAVWRTQYLESLFHEMIIDSGTACQVDLFPSYFQTRTAYEIPDIILNWTALLISSYLSWHLLKTYNAQSFKCVGAPKHIVRIYKFFMAVMACLQLEVFALSAAMALWVDKLTNSAVGIYSEYTTAYQVLFISSTIVLIPWIAMGWFALRREKKLMMLIFLITAFVLLSCWGVMFYSLVYRWTLEQWPYLACFTFASFILIIASMVLGIVCWLNFNKGLAEYLNVEDALASANFMPEVFKHDVEKGSSDFTIKQDPRIVAFDRELAQPTFYLSSPLPNDKYHKSTSSISKDSISSDLHYSLKPPF
jgi:hypothetical protein